MFASFLQNISDKGRKDLPGTEGGRGERMEEEGWGEK
jgi:hypothetical protein